MAFLVMAYDISCACVFCLCLEENVHTQVDEYLNPYFWLSAFFLLEYG